MASQSVPAPACHSTSLDDEAPTGCLCRVSVLCLKVFGSTFLNLRTPLLFPIHVFILWPSVPVTFPSMLRAIPWSSMPTTTTSLLLCQPTFDIGGRLCPALGILMQVLRQVTRQLSFKSTHTCLICASLKGRLLNNFWYVSSLHGFSSRHRIDTMHSILSTASVLITLLILLRHAIDLRLLLRERRSRHLHRHQNRHLPD